jgi:hypothetical protein
MRIFRLGGAYEWGDWLKDGRVDGLLRVRSVEIALGMEGALVHLFASHGG